MHPIKEISSNQLSPASEPNITIHDADALLTSALGYVPAGIQLRPFAVDPAPSQADLDDLLAQRIACGWRYDFIDTWVDEIKAGWRLIWFIHVPGVKESIGMTALTLYDPLDRSIADLHAPDLPGVRTEVSSLFVYPEYRNRGVATEAILMMEDVARGLGSTITTINTAAVGPTVAKYAKMGYVEYKPKEQKYPLEIVSAMGLPADYCYAAFLEKKLQ